MAIGMVDCCGASQQMCASSKLYCVDPYRLVSLTSLDLAHCVTVFCLLPLHLVRSENSHQQDTAEQIQSVSRQRDAVDRICINVKLQLQASAALAVWVNVPRHLFLSTADWLTKQLSL